MTTYRRFMVVVFSSALLCTLIGSNRAAFATGTGDDPARTRDVLTPSEVAMKEALEGETEALLQPNGLIQPMIVDAPYKYLYTPSHKQENGNYCGPATVQIIHDYYGTPKSQLTYASYMGTGASGTDFSKVDDALRYYTGRSYYYYGSLTESGFNTKVSHSLLNHSMPLAADVKILADVWPNYKVSHLGHIIPLEAFDWRYMTIRINDPYNEADYYSYGGQTFGHMTYSQKVIWSGVVNHFRKAVVSAP